mgnify:CR=1 FL=1
MKKRLNSYNKLAEERTIMSNERTLLSYIRTALTAVIFGLAILQFTRDNNRFIGYSAIIVGAVILFIGFVHFILLKKRIKKEAGDDED